MVLHEQHSADGVCGLHRGQERRWLAEQWHSLSSGANAGAKCGDDGLLIMLILADITDSDLLDRADGDGEEDMVRV